MPTRPYTIAPFKNLPGIQEIIGIGDVRQGRGSALETEIEVLVAKESEAKPDSPSSSSMADDSTIINAERDCQLIWVGCGQLDLLTIGSRWEQGHRLQDAQSLKFEGPVQYTDGNTAYLGIGDDEFPSKLIQYTECFLLNRTDIDLRSGTNLPPKYLLLPKIEMARALFGVSSKLLLELFDGSRDATVTNDRGLYDRINSKRMTDELVRICCDRRLTKLEALTVGLILTNQKILDSFNSVFRELMLQKCWRELQPTKFTMLWPFSVGIHMAYEGRWIKYESPAMRFLITKITALDLKFDFSEIDMHHWGTKDIQGGITLPPSMGRLRYARTEIIRLTTGYAPSGGRQQIALSSQPVKIPDAVNVKINDIAHGGLPHPNGGILGEDPQTEASFGTAGREAGADPAIGQAVISRSGKTQLVCKNPRKIALEATWKAVEYTAKQKGWSIEPFPLCPLTEDSCPFDFSNPNEFLLVEVETDWGFVVIADYGTYLSTKRSLGILIRHYRGNALNFDIENIRKTAKSCDGAWGASNLVVPEYTIKRTTRPQEILNNHKIYGDLIFRKINEYLNTSP